MLESPLAMTPIGSQHPLKKRREFSFGRTR